MFADDTKIMSSNPMEIQEDLDRFVQWCDQNKMEINVEKTHLMMFRGDESQKFKMKNVNLLKSPFEPVFSEDQSWVEQTKTGCNKAYRAFFNLKKNTSPTTEFVVFTPKYVLWVCHTNFDTLLQCGMQTGHP